MKYTLHTTASKLTRAVRACAAVVPAVPLSKRGQSERTCQVLLEATDAGVLVLSGTDRVMFVRASLGDVDPNNGQLDALAEIAPSLPLPVWLGIVSEIGTHTYAVQDPDAEVFLEFARGPEGELAVMVTTESWSRHFEAAHVEPLRGAKMFKTAHALAELHPRRHLHTFSRSVFLRLGRLVDLTEPTEIMQLVNTGNTDSDPVLVHIIGDQGTWCEVAVKPLKGADAFGGL